MTYIEKIKKMGAVEMAEFLYAVSMCHVDETTFCGKCPINALNCDVEGIIEFLISEAE
jgi:hypothetical protein